jgi:hypothetical protein
MSTYALSSASSDAALSYGQNLRRAFGEFLAALFAVRPVGDRANVRDHLAVLRLANQYEAHSPSLAAELRLVAGRD